MWSDAGTTVFHLAGLTTPPRTPETRLGHKNGATTSLS